MENKRATGIAIGKVILMGEHAVVYGEPAVAIPFPQVSMETTVSRQAGPVSLDCFYHQGLFSKAPSELAGLKTLVQEIVASFNAGLRDFDLQIESTIPPGRGMGSSAAVAAATTRALYTYFGQPLTPDILLKWIEVGERIVHGNPSGIDGAVVAGEKSLYFRKEMGPKTFSFKTDAHLLVADTGQVGKTKDAVLSVRRFMEARPQQGKTLIGRLGDLADEAKAYLETDKPFLLGKAMSEAQRILSQLGVSNAKLDQLVTAALENGALGAKLTGGGQGGCMIALAATEDQGRLLCEQLLKAGAKNTWMTSLKGDL